MKTKIEKEIKFANLNDVHKIKRIDPNLKKILTTIAHTIRSLSIDAIQKAASGHPGLPMGCAELGAYLYGYYLKHNPKDSKWVNRDRFILSAGHGSMWLYSCLHLSGYNISLADIQRFRQLHSNTPGHPESLITDGVETTTGPLGQGLGNGVGQALGLKMLAAQFNTDEYKIFDSKVYVLVGDGCIMEGISAEACSLAGHLNLNNLVVIYDSNKVCLDGPLGESCSEDTKGRFRSYGWDVFEVNGNDFDSFDPIFEEIRTNQERPCLVIAHTTIGHGSPNKAGSNKIHGGPLGEKEISETKAFLCISPDEFYVSDEVKNFFSAKILKDRQTALEWNTTFEKWGSRFPEKLQEFHCMQQQKLPENLEQILWEIKTKEGVSSRKISYDILSSLASQLPYLIGGSADISSSDMAMIAKFPLIFKEHFKGRTIKFGAREFGMAAMAIGLHQTGFILPYVSTYLTFSDYMRNAIRMAALQKNQVIFQLTHDSIFIGEDGPTHQAIEHLASLRAIPHLQVIRPADSHEVRMAWLAALRYKGPTALILSRQNLSELNVTSIPFEQGMGRGAYIVKKEITKPDFTLIATGSELLLALEVSVELEKLGKQVRVISMPSWDLFEKQDKIYKDSLFEGEIGKRVSIEAAVSLGWHKYIGREGIAISLETFGASAPAHHLADEFGLNVTSILRKIL